MVIFVDGDKLQTEAGYFMNTSEAMTEAEVRAFFQRGGQPAADVEAMLAQARAKRDRLG